MQEVWKDVSGFENKYKVSNLGRVKSIFIYSDNNAIKRFRREKILHKIKKSIGYEQVTLSKNNTQGIYLVHRIVLSAFLENKENKPQVNHKNGIKNDNRLENLEWCNASENGLHSYRVLGRVRIKRFGKDNHRSKKVIQKTSNGEVVKIWESMNEAHRELNYDSGCICRCCKGESKEHKGFKWEYVSKR